MRLRPAAVAGSFYPARASVLTEQIAGFLASGGEPSPRCPKVLVCPHAGIVYSGRTAGTAYAQLQPHRHRIRRVVLLGPTHRVGVRGLAVPSVDAFVTPLGMVAVDRTACQQALRLSQVVEQDAPHAMEHSLEVQLPFLQLALDDFSLLPLAVGDATPAEVAEVLADCWGGDETLIVISSDLSHFHSCREAERIDRETVAAILALAGPLDHQQACGATPLNGLLIEARRRQLTPTLLELCNSGDTAGDKARVVGYAALRFDAPLSDAKAGDGHHAG